MHAYHPKKKLDAEYGQRKMVPGIVRNMVTGEDTEALRPETHAEWSERLVKETGHDFQYNRHLHPRKKQRNPRR